MYELIGGGNQWNEIFRHNGPYFPQKYEKHNIPVYINNNKIILPELAEEYITIYCNYLETEYIKNPRFNKNFLLDFNKLLPNDLKLSDMKEININEINKHVKKQKEQNKQISKEEKQRKKEKQDKIEEPYKSCIIDGAQQKVGNYRIEPPGIFMGRGNHPKLGRLKKRILPQDITLNLDKNAPIPKANEDGRWKKIVHKKDAIWLATWVDEISGKNKYIFTSMESIFKSKSDESKFDLAKKLKSKVKSIRESYERNLSSDSVTNRQLSVALYFIDNFALRVGGKKNIKEKADTVGVTSLRVEHITLLPDYTIKLDFLGKDSIRFCKKTKVIQPVYNNLESFIRGKNNKESLFDKISASSLNDYLDSFLKGLTAKVWRTFNASYTFQKELNKMNEDKLKNLDESERTKFLIQFFNQANTAVALLCNHQKNVSSNFEEGVKKINDKIKDLQKKKLEFTKKGKNNKAVKLGNKIKILKVQKDTKTKMKNVSLGTSKTNYIDPRIIFSFIKKYEIPEDKLFTKTLLSRFEWARSVSKDYKF